MEAVAAVGVGQPIAYKGDMANLPGKGVVVAVCEVGPSYSMNFGAGKLVANPREAYDVRLVDGRSFRAVNAGNIGGSFADKSCRFMWVDGPVLSAAEVAAFNEAWADVVIEQEAAKKAAVAIKDADDSAKCVGLDVKFQKYYVAGNGAKAKAWYSLDNRIDGRNCVTIYAKEYSGDLVKVFGSLVIDNSDSQSDYFEKGKVVLFEGNPLYAAARARAEAAK